MTSRHASPTWRQWAGLSLPTLPLFMMATRGTAFADGVRLTPVDGDQPNPSARRLDPAKPVDAAKPLDTPPAP